MTKVQLAIDAEVSKNVIGQIADATEDSVGPPISTSRFTSAGGTTIAAMADDEKINVSFEDLTKEQKGIVKKIIEEFQVKCLRSFSKVRNQVIQKTPMPKVFVDEKIKGDWDRNMQMAQNVIDETLRPMIREAVISSMVQEQKGLAYSSSIPSANGMLNRPMDLPRLDYVPEASLQPMFTSSQPIAFSPQRNLSSEQPIAGGYDGAYVENQRPFIQASGYYNRPTVDATSGAVNQIADVIKDRFGLKPKEQSYVYRRPYPEWFDYVALPMRYEVPDFTKFSGQDNISTMEHISWFLTQCGEAARDEVLKVRFFPLSLTGSAFSWYASLPFNSIQGWADLEEQFHRHFFAGTHEMGLTDLMSLKQRDGESAHEYVQRFRDLKSRCYSLSLSDGQIVELAFQGLLPMIKEKFSPQEFESLGHLAQKVSASKSWLQKVSSEFHSQSQSDSEEDC